MSTRPAPTTAPVFTQARGERLLRKAGVEFGSGTAIHFRAFGVIVPEAQRDPVLALATAAGFDVKAHPLACTPGHFIITNATAR